MTVQRTKPEVCSHAGFVLSYSPLLGSPWTIAQASMMMAAAGARGRPMGLLATLLSVTLIATSPTTASSAASDPSAAGQQQLCFGQAATIVGAPGEFVLGTEGPDVIMTNSAREVWALGGDDLVCVTGTKYLPDSSGVVMRIGLGPGADRLLGSGDDENVYANNEAAGEVDFDIIDTAGGRDYVQSGGRVKGAGVSQDVIALGAGRDELVITGPVSAATLMGGPGRDVLTFEAKAPFGVRMKIDNLHQELSLAGVGVVGRWSSFSGFNVDGFVDAPMTFLGTDRPEQLGSRHDHFAVGHRWKVDVRMRGGRDTAVVYGGAPGSRYDGGGGPDLVWSVDSAALIYGKGGDDQLRGSGGNDTLIGGPGNDRGLGARGIDRCVTEVRINCER